MQPLITRNDISMYRQIAKSCNDAKLNEIIFDTQILDLQPLIGEKLFTKIIDDPLSYNDLLNGCFYSNKDGNYNNYGLKMVLAYFAYGRHIMFSGIVDTAYSVVEKLNDNSRPVDASSKKTVYNLNREAAFQIWENVKNYLIRTNEPDFAPSQQTRSTGLKFNKIA